MSLTKWCWFLTLHFILLIVSHSLLRLHDKVLRSTVWSVCALSIKKPSFFLVLQGLSWNIISYFLYSHCFVLRCCVNETTYDDPCQIQHHYIFICTLICSTCTDCTVSQCWWKIDVRIFNKLLRELTTITLWITESSLNLKFCSFSSAPLGGTCGFLLQSDFLGCLTTRLDYHNNNIYRSCRWFWLKSCWCHVNSIYFSWAANKTDTQSDKMMETSVSPVSNLPHKVDFSCLALYNSWHVLFKSLF